MRIIVTVLTNKKPERNFAVDFYYSWPFVAFECLDSEDEDDPSL